MRKLFRAIYHQLPTSAMTDVIKVLDAFEAQVQTDPFIHRRVTIRISNCRVYRIKHGLSLNLSTCRWVWWGGLKKLLSFETFGSKLSFNMMSLGLEPRNDQGDKVFSLCIAKNIETKLFKWPSELASSGNSHINHSSIFQASFWDWSLLPKLATN